MSLFTPSPPGWLDDERVAEEINALLHLAPVHIQRLPPDHWQRARPRALLEVLIENIGTIEDYADIKQIQRIGRKYGYTTPSFHVIGGRLLEFVLAASDTVTRYVQDHLDSVNLGRFRRAAVSG